MSRNNDMRRIVGALTNIENSSQGYDGDKRLAGVTLIRRQVIFSTEALNANASNALAANATQGQTRMIANGRVLGAYFIATANVTAAGPNNATIAVVKLHTANGVAVSTALATQTTNTSANGGTGNIVLGVAAELTAASGANGRFTAGQILAPQLTENSGGVALPAGTVVVDVELESAATDYPY